MALDRHLALENMHTDGVWCPIAQIQSKLKEGPAWESVLLLSPLTPDCLNMINDIARRGPLCAFVPPSLAANTVGEEHLQTWPLLNVHKCVLLGKEPDKSLHELRMAMQHHT